MLSIQKVVTFDTTMRDGELTPGVTMNLQEKISLAQLLEKMQVDVEVSYPGNSQKDFDKLLSISKLIKESIVCGLARTNKEEILKVAEAIKPASRGRINTYTLVNIKDKSKINQKQVLEEVSAMVSLARNHCGDVEWSAFDATRSEPDFLCKVLETAIWGGATPICISDSLGVAHPEQFSQLIQMIYHRVPNIDQAIIAVHCHDDSELAVENSIFALEYGIRQIKCSINGLGARKVNADLEKVVTEI